jgi:hypothetical protein
MRADGPGRLGVLATDDADDSYDLSWMSDLPIDELRAIKMLRQLLKRLFAMKRGSVCWRR